MKIKPLNLSYLPTLNLKCSFTSQDEPKKRFNPQKGRPAKDLMKSSRGLPTSIVVVRKTTDNKLKLFNISKWGGELAGKMILLFT